MARLEALDERPIAPNPEPGLPPTPQVPLSPTGLRQFQTTFGEKPIAQQGLLERIRQPFLQQTQPSVDRQRVQAAVALHIGGKLPGIEFTRALEPISERFMEMAANNPQMVSALEQDVNTLLALTDEQIAGKIARGEPLSQLGDVFDAIAEVSWEIGATDLATRLNAESADVVKGKFDALTVQDALALTLEGQQVTPTPGARFAPDHAKASEFQALFDVPGAWSYSRASRTLAVTLGDQTVGIETRPGFDPENHLDVMAEVVAAQADGRILGGELTGSQKTRGPGRVAESFISLAHDIGGWLDEHPGVKTSIDGLWDAATRFSLFNIARQATGGDEGGAPLARHSDRMRDEKGEMTAESVRLASAIPFPEDAIVASIAREWMAETNGALGSQDALALAASSVQENRDQLVAEYESLTAEELLKELETEIEGESTLGRAIESGMGTAVQALEEWDRLAHWIGVNTIDVVGDYLQAAEAIGENDWEQGFEHIKAMGETQEWGVMAADYFGITDPNWRDATNLAVSIGFDPSNLIFPGAKGLRSLAAKGLTDTRYAGLYLKMGQFPHIARQIANGGRVVMEAPPGVLNALDAANQWDSLADDQLIEVFHATTKESAEAMSKRGILAAEKVPGPNATLLTRDGVYVGDDPDRLRFLFGGDGPDKPGTVVGITVKKADLVNSEEGIRLYGETDFRGALGDPTAGARVPGDIDPGRVRILTEEDIAKAREPAGPGQVSLNNRGVMSVLGMSGLDDPEIIDLMRLALDPEATTGQVNAVLTRALSKDWLGEGPMRMVRHSTVEGMGRMLDSLAGGRISQEHLGEIMQFFSKASVGRTFKLGENRSLDQFADLLITFFPADPETAARLYMDAAQARMAAGDDLAMSGVVQTSKEQARRSAWEAGGTLNRMGRAGAGDPQAIGENMRTIEDALSRLGDEGLDEATELSLRTQLNSMHRLMSRRFEKATPQLQAAREKRRLAQNQLKKATALEADMAANAARNAMAGKVYELYDEVAKDLNKTFGSDVIPVVNGKVNPLAPDVPVRDWSAVTGVRKLIAGDDPDLSLMMGLSVDDVELARQADAIGMFNRSQKMLLPASPYEVLLYKKIGHDQSLLAAAARAMRHERVKKVTRGMRMVFAFNLLVNPLTAGKITLDETLRFLASSGELGSFTRATLAGMPLGVGKVTEGVVRQTQKFMARNGEAIVNPYAKAHGRNVGGFSADDFADFGWVTRPTTGSKAEYRDQVERWINGSLLQDRRFREYARWIDAAETLDDGTKIPPSGWVEWWDDGAGLNRPGKADVNPTTVTIRGKAITGSELTASDAFNIMDRVFEHWMNTVVDESARPLMREILLKAARGERGILDVVKDARLLNAISQVPGLSGQTGFGSQVFNIFFGAPSGRRAGVFFEHYYDEAMGLLMSRHGDRVLTVDKLMEFAGVDRPTAEFWLKQGSDNAIVSQMIRETGARTEAQLRARAAAYAERRSDDLMYRFTATSLAGRAVESGLVLPFARAQTDFLSWWMNHMFKPMTTRLPLEARAKLPGMVQTMLSKAEQIPLNVRAWAKYAHIAAVTNNDDVSVIDQMIDNLTFFPTKFGSDFLLDVSPQLGPMPAWLFDQMVDKGMIDEQLEREFEAIFPALSFTDADNDDLFDRILPNSRRSIRDLTVGMMQTGYALRGEDVHTNPGVWGQIANVLSEGKEPASTGDFQVALAADFLKNSAWEVVPGSEEWTTGIREVAIAGAVQANRAEWSQDMRDRIYPLADYDREYRALRAYESLFSEERFAALVKSGIFAANDLLENDDGTPRILETWQRYEAGTATQEELAWLDDRVTTAYFNAGRLEVLPGFSYMDFLHLSNPELAVNLIQKSEDSGIPVRSDEHAEFKQTYINGLTGRVQNIPEGDTGREIRAEARRRGWIVSVPVEEWATDASQAVYKSGARAIRGVWESVSHRTWQAGIKKSIENQTFKLPGKQAMILKAAGLEQVEAGQQFTYGQFYTLLHDFSERFDVTQPTLLNMLENGAVKGQLARHNDEFGLAFLEALGKTERELDKLGYDSIEDWPEEVKQNVRDRFSNAIDLGYTTVEDYRQEIEPMFGPIDYQPPQPPPVAELEAGFSLAGDDLADLAVIDGDTVSVMLEDGPMRVRFIGINAPEATQPGYQEARTMLEEVVEDAEEVTIGIFDPEMFGMIQQSAPGERRLLAWLYVDGVPIYDPTVFGAANPRGAGVGGRVVDLPAILAEGRQ